MSTQTPSASYQVDPAAVFGAALSLWNACHKYAEKNKCNLSDAFNGIDQLMRVAMDVANGFERWSCQHVNFNELTDVWPYLLEDTFGETCLDITSLKALESFDDSDCLRVAMRLHLP